MRASQPPTSVGPSPQSSLACSVGRFPTEILQEIVILALGQYLTDILLAPESTRSWDAIGILLHVNHCFRCCALKVLNLLWEGTFVDCKTGSVFRFAFREISHTQARVKGFRVTTRTRLYTCEASRNSLVPIPMRSSPHFVTFFPCARQRRRTSDSADPSSCT